MANQLIWYKSVNIEWTYHQIEFFINIPISSDVPSGNQFISIHHFDSIDVIYRRQSSKIRLIFIARSTMHWAGGCNSIESPVGLSYPSSISVTAPPAGARDVSFSNTILDGSTRRQRSTETLRQLKCYAWRRFNCASEMTFHGTESATRRDQFFFTSNHQSKWTWR